MGGLRFVQDGRITTTAGVTSGVPGALKVMEDMAGAVEAERVGDGVLGFDGAIEYLAQHTDRATAVSAAKMIDYPTAHLDLPAGGASIRVPGLIALGLLLAILAGSLPVAFRSAIRRRRESHGWRLP